MLSSFRRNDACLKGFFETAMALQIVIIVLCLFLSAYFSATETAFTTMNRIRLKTLAEKGNKRATLALRLEENYDRLLTTILIGNNIVNILSASLATLVFVDLLQNESLGTTISTVVLTLLVLIFGEISPKTLAKKHPEGFAMFSAPIIYGISIVFTPFTFLFKKWQDLLSRIFKKNEDEEVGITEEELISIIEEAEEDGDIDKEESSLIKSAIEFNDLEVGDIFTPRIDITAVPADATKEEITTVFNESGYSRIPVYEDDLDNITGILYYKDFFTLVKGKKTSVAEIVKPVIYVTKNQKINDLLKELQNKQLHLAVVTDEFGSTAGIVTLEDILEEIVGEIWDEHDERVEELREVGEKEFIVSGKASLTKFFDTLDIAYEEDPDILTVNGWAMSILGRIPEVGDRFEAEGLLVEVLEMDARRIENLRIVDCRKQENSESGEEE